jgi:hypothetical protein
MTLAAAAAAFGIWRATASRDWAYAKTHLLRTLREENF